MSTAPSRGDGLLHPVPLGAMLVLGLNDHWGKAAWPGLVTGKLSDFAGMIFFPILLGAMVEWARSMARAPWRPIAAAGPVLATAIVFSLVKTWPPMGMVYRWGLGVLQSPVTGRIHPVTLHQDPTDLVALTALVIPWVLMQRRARM